MKGIAGGMHGFHETKGWDTNRDEVWSDDEVKAGLVSRYADVTQPQRDAAFAYAKQQTERYTPGALEAIAQMPDSTFTQMGKTRDEFIEETISHMVANFSVKYMRALLAGEI
jgi:hypothetical protein